VNGLNDASPNIISGLYTEVQSHENLKLLSFLDSSFSGLVSEQTQRHLDCVPYWKGSDEPTNAKFIDKFLQKYPQTQSRWNISAEQELAYSSILMFSEKMKKNGNISSLYGSTFRLPAGNVTLLSSSQAQRRFFVVAGPKFSEESFQLVHTFSLLSKFRSQPWDRFRTESREYSCDWSLKTETPGHFLFPSIRVGILHSSTGSLAISEKALIRADILAIDRINDNGGILGSYVLPFFRDGQSDPEVFATEARKLIVEDSVQSIFGCWTSSSRQKVAPVVKEYNNQLYYPVQYEGSECEEHVFYGGATPNQQLEPAIHWALWEKKTDFYLVGSDYVYPRTSNQIAQNYIKTFGGMVHGEEYVPLNDIPFVI